MTTGQAARRGDFPVTWEEPGDEGLFWYHPAQFFPKQMTPLEFEVTGLLSARGFGFAARQYGMPVVGWRSRRVNTYLYRAVVTAAPHEMADRARQSRGRLEAAALELATAWEASYLPEIEGHVQAMAAVDLGTATTTELSGHLDELLDRLERLWQIHFCLTIPLYYALSEYDELFRDLFGAGDDFDSYRLLGGLPNLTVAIGDELWELGRHLLALPQAREALTRSAGRPAAEVLAELEGSVDGRAALGELRSFLRRHGRRTELGEIAGPSWLEDPTPVVDTLRHYLSQPDDADPRLVRARAASERERGAAEARDRLAGYPRPVVEQFDAWLRAAQAASVLSEDHTVYIDLGGQYEARRVIVEAGRRLVRAGALAEVDDAFLLHLDELRRALVSGIDVGAVADERRAEMDRFRAVRPPPALGTPPPSQAGGSFPADPLSRSALKYIGLPAAAPPAAPGTLAGTAGSPGRARGPARVVGSLGEAARLGPGDVLVAATTSPSWTPLFASAAAVVTDTGGVLSHCAIVAREYGIPAVVGVGNATAVLRDGEPIEVDGTAGLVRTETS